MVSRAISVVMANKRTAELAKAQKKETRSEASDLSRSGSSTKSSSPTEQNKAQIDFQFLNFSHPSDAKASRARKTVRSHVTRQQHQREHAAAAARRAKSYQDTPDDHDMPLPQRSQSSTSILSEQPPPITIPVRALHPSVSPEDLSPSPSPAPSPIEPVVERLDPTEVYPEAWHPYIPRIMDHYIGIMGVDNRDLDGPDEKGVLRTRFFPLVLTDAALLHAVMLVAASHYGKSRGSRSHSLDLLQLRGMAIRAINDALGDENRATSDQVILSVAKMACYEVLYGDRNIHNTHMTGLLRLVSMRGGLPALGLDGLTERFLLWVDANTAHITNGPVRFDRAIFPSSVPHPRPDARRFAGSPPTQ